ncbi:hypothetical protein LJC61_07755 [Ruminococcaceae bacterium OttesenSCG-928-A16]|nr:hypothetical protein [Ruminococcaceae bacterium OttesenSCG-928-A16]
MSSAASPLPALLAAANGNWHMSFQSIHFLLFLPIVVGAYFVLPVRLRKGWLLVASYYFYFFAAPKYLVLLLAGTLFTYIIGRVIGSAKTARAKHGWLFLGIAGSVLVLAFFKYNGYLQGFLSNLSVRFGLVYSTSWFTTAAAMGISYYTFTAIGYLIEVAQGTAPAEKNLATYALFLGFFPSVSLGPINRANGLLPQLTQNNKKFNPQAAANALRLIAIGFFKKLAVADTLRLFVDAVYASPEALAGYTGLSLTLAAVLFALQLYFDFSGYTDIARGSAGLLGIELPENFNTPFFATNFSGFWARWHMSLSGWLQDYIFTPLVWSRWTEKLPIIGKKIKKPPVLSSIFVVFFISGIWHGDTLCFAVWGILQAVFRIGEELLHRTLGKPQKKPPLFSRIGKTTLVLVLWVESLVFFRVGMMRAGTVSDALAALARQFSEVSYSATINDVYRAIWNGFYNQRPLVLAFAAFMAVCLAAALWADWAQCFKLKGKSLANGIAALRPVPRWFVYFFITLACFAAFIAQSGGFGGASFLYGGF